MAGFSRSFMLGPNPIFTPMAPPEGDFLMTGLDPAEIFLSGF